MDVTSLFGVPVQSGIEAGIKNIMSGVDPAAAQRVQAAAPAQEHRYVERSGKHKGIAGVARDILGTLGDFLLTRLHMPAMYGPSQQQRKLEAAWQGHDEDPMAAIDRVTDVDFNTGNKLRDQYIDNKRQQALVDSTAETRAARVALATEALNSKIRMYGASMLGSMSNWSEDKRKQFYPQMREQVINAGKRQGLDLSGELPEDYDPVKLDAFIDAAVPVGTQRAQRLTGQRDLQHYEVAKGNLKERITHDRTTEGISQQNADTNTGRLAETKQHNRTTEQDNRDKETDRVVLKTVELEDKRKHYRATEPIVRRQNGHEYRYVNGAWVPVK